MPFKRWTPGTVEKYPYRIIFYINGMLTYMDLPAENEQDAKEQILEIYKDKLGEFELVEIVCRL